MATRLPQGYSCDLGQLVSRAWSDPAFKQRLLSDPAAVLKEQGIDVGPGVEVRVVENTENVVYLALPPQPSEGLSDEQLDQVAGGTTLGTVGSVGSMGTICGSLACAGTAGTVGTQGAQQQGR